MNMITEYRHSEILILGCGNILFGDDGFGPAVVEYFEQNFDLPPEACILNAGLSARDILFTIVLSENRPRKIIIVDAIDAGRVPGEVFELDIKANPENKIDDFSTHQAPTWNLLRELNEMSGVEVKLLSAQVQHIPEEVSPGLSQVMKNSVPKICEKIFDNLK